MNVAQPFQVLVQGMLKLGSRDSRDNGTWRCIRICRTSCNGRIEIFSGGRGVKGERGLSHGELRLVEG